MWTHLQSNWQKDNERSLPIKAFHAFHVIVIKFESI